MSEAALVFAKVAKERIKRAQRWRSHYAQWMPPQVAFHKDPSKRKLLRLGNQWGGKTVAGVTEVDWRCTGKHPYLKVNKPPIEAWIICASWSQSIAIQQKYYDWCDKDELSSETVFDPRRGFKGTSPAVLYKNGSIVRFKTTNQGGLNLAGATVNVVLIDEPTEQRIYQELQKRVMRQNGVMLMTLTPINGPTEYLKVLVDEGQISDHHYPLRPEYLIPVGAQRPMCLADGTAMDAAWIAQIRSETLSREEPVIVDGEWETRQIGRVFSMFDDRLNIGHVTNQVPTGKFQICVGIDHGARDFKQVAVLCAFAEDTGSIHVLGEYVGDGGTTSEEDAVGILSLIRKWGFRWEDIDFVTGDKPYDAGKGDGIGKKSNAEIETAICAELGITDIKRLFPRIKQAKTGKGAGRGSIDQGCNWLHRRMVQRRFTIQAGCERLIEAFRKWDYTDSDYKDPIDALRYATWPFAMREKKKDTGGTVYVY